MIYKNSKRPAVVLLITLFFIVALGITITAIMKQSEYFLDKINKTNFYTQSNLIFNDLKTILKEKSKDINDSSSLYMLTSLPIIIYDKKSNIKIEMNCKSGAFGFNPNCLSNNINSAEFHKCYDIVFALFSSLKIANPDILINTIADSIDSDKSERYSETEIVIENPWFKQGHIESLDRFKKIVHFYALKNDDYTALNIHWERYFSFKNREIDFNYIDPLLAKAISPEIDLGSLSNLKANGEVFPIEKLEDAGISAEAKNKLTEAEVKTFVPLLQCSIELIHNKNWSRTEFYYDIEKKVFNYSKTIF